MDINKEINKKAYEHQQEIYKKTYKHHQEIEKLSIWSAYLPKNTFLLTLKLYYLSTK